MYRPKGPSLSQQWLLIAVITMTPVLIVVSYTFWSLYQQLQLQRDLVNRAERLQAQQAQLIDDSRDLERFARQFRLLRDDTFLAHYTEKYEAFLEGITLLKNFSQRERDQQQDTVAESQHEKFIATLMKLKDSVVKISPGTVEDLDEETFSSALKYLSQNRAQLSYMVSEYADVLQNRGELALHQILRRLFLMSLISLPLTVTLMGLGFAQMLRPIHRLSSAIRNLGHGDWDSPIAVSGPRDFQVLGERLEWLRGQLHETDRQKHAFLRHVSHELKTPLSAILEAGSLLQDEVPGPLNSQQESIIRILLENAQNLQELIQQLLNYNLTTHGVGLRHQPVMMASLCAKLTDRLDQQNWRHRVCWEYEGHPEILVTDPQLLEMILSNLLSNAYHYSPHNGCVSVHWGLEGPTAWISVTDEGPGINPAEREMIFQPFVQGHVRRHGSVQGSGVGLAIVKESIVRLGGQVHIESRDGHQSGSRFLLRFPTKLLRDEGDTA